MKKYYLIFGMCDESFSINYTAAPPPDVDRGWFMFWVTLLNHFYWFSGSALGGYSVLLSLSLIHIYAFPALIKSTLQKSSGNANATGSALLESHVIVSSSAMSCESSLLSGSTFVNGKYYISLLNSLLGRESNFSITAKTLDTTTLTMTNFQILSIGAVFAIIIPLALLVVGVVVWLRRRHK